MRRWIAAVTAPALVAWCATAVAGSAVEPQTVTITNLRAQAVETISQGTIYRSSSLLFTNCVLYATGSATGGVQTLTNVTVEVSVGNLSTNIDYTATVQSAAGGTWWKTITVPDLASFTLQVRVTDENTNRYIYPAKNMTAEQSMY